MQSWKQAWGHLGEELQKHGLEERTEASGSLSSLGSTDFSSYEERWARDPLDPVLGPSFSDLTGAPYMNSLFI